MSSPALRRSLGKSVHISLFSSVLALTLSLAPPSSEGALIGHFEFQNNLDNSIAGNHLKLESTVADVFVPQGWSWDSSVSPDPGLILTRQGAGAETPLNVFSVGLIFQFSETSSYAKILDFSSRTSDSGLYVQGQGLSLYPNSPISTGTISSNTMAAVLMTRGEGGAVTLYLNGIAIDNLNVGAAFELQQELFFFLDNTSGGNTGEVSPRGIVSQIKIWDHELSSVEAATAFAPIPEPGTVGLLAASGLALGLWSRFRKTLSRR